MTLIRQVLDAKGHEISSIAPRASVLDAIRLMAERGIGALVVMEGGELVGIVSERDYARRVILEGKASKDTPVADIMATDVICADPGQTIEQGLATMTEKRIRHLPVVEGGAVVGIVSIGDLVKAVIADQRFVIDQLQSYIAG